jgi:hypothetical protein
LLPALARMATAPSVLDENARFAPDGGKRRNLPVVADAAIEGGSSYS